MGVGGGGGGSGRTLEWCKRLDTIQGIQPLDSAPASPPSSHCPAVPPSSTWPTQPLPLTYFIQHRMLGQPTAEALEPIDLFRGGQDLGQDLEVVLVDAPPLLRSNVKKTAASSWADKALPIFRMATNRFCWWLPSRSCKQLACTSRQATGRHRETTQGGHVSHLTPRLST